LTLKLELEREMAMVLVYEGKTKNVFDNADGTLTLKLKDDATGKDGVFDPGENAVALSIDGLGRESLRITAHYFGLIDAAGIPTHYVSCDFEQATMTVKAAEIFGLGLEFVCRAVADGSFIRRYGAYAKPGDTLPFLTEVTLKDDNRSDPPITKDALVALGIMTADEYETCTALTKKAAEIISADLAKKQLTLHDLKFEFGKNAAGEIMLMDEISAGCMRVYKAGKLVPPMELGGLILNN